MAGGIARCRAGTLPPRLAAQGAGFVASNPEGMQYKNLSDEQLLESLNQVLCDPAQARQRCRDLVAVLLVEEPDRLARVAGSFLAGAGVLPGDHPADETADAMMEADPKRFEAPVAAAAESATGPLARFRLTRAVFRRFPGRYRERMLEVGREVLRTEEADGEVALWLLRKFGAELVPELLAMMRRPRGAGRRMELLRESVRILGPGADPLLQAGLGSGCEELENAAREALQRLGGRAAEV